MMKKIFLILFLLSVEICDAQQWFPLQSGLSGTNSISDKVGAMCVDTANNALYVGGNFLFANDTILTNNIAKWNGNNWSPVIMYFDSTDTVGLNGLNSGVSSLLIKNNNLYLSVNYNTNHPVGELSLNTFIVDALGFFNGNVNQLLFYNDTLYACGAFTAWHTATGPNIPVTRIAKWDGTNWKQVGTGIGGGASPEVHALCVHQNKLYAAGIFETAGGTYCKNIACWNDTSWSAVGSGFGFSGQFDCILLSLASYKNKLFLGGTFHQSDGYISTGLAYWNDTTYKPGGVSADLIYAMKEFNGKLYIGGWEAGQGISPWDRIACYNDTSWSDIGFGPSNPVLALEVFDSSLYAGGRFNYMGPGDSVFLFSALLKSIL